MSQRGSVEAVVRDGLCNSCGTCVAICPQGAVGMVETPGGLLFAKVSKESCDCCGLCLRACGGSHLENGLLSGEADPFKGEVLAAYCGYATDPEVRLRGQSGGVVTALLSFLMDSGEIDKALVTRMPENGTLRPEPFLARGKEELFETQGSKYCPAAVNAEIPREVGKNCQKLALVGLSCHIHGLRNAQQFQANWKDGVGVAIGLFCDRTLTYAAIDFLVNKGNVAKEDVAAFRYRDKMQGGWPGSIFIRTKAGNNIRVPSRERQIIKDYFTPLRCRLCFDKMNVLSDIAVGDAWKVKEDKAGFSVLLARTQSGLALIERAKKAGYLCLDEIDPEKIFSGQKIEERRRQWSAFSRLRLKLGEKMPDFQINSKDLNADIGALEKTTISQYKWSEKHLSVNSSNKIIRSVNRKQIFLRIKRKLASMVR